MILTEGLNHNKTIYHHALLLPDIWKVVLQCFSTLDAIQLDCEYGATLTQYLVRERVSGIPNANTWLQAVYNNCTGLMVYLLQYKIPCTNLEDIIQYAVDKNRLETLVFFVGTGHVFYDFNGYEISHKSICDMCPKLDRAIKKNYLSIVKYTLSRFGVSSDKVLKNPMLILRYIMARNMMRMLRLIVPCLLKITDLSGLYEACSKGHKRIVIYSLLHLDPGLPDLPDDLLKEAAKNGHLDIVVLLQKFNNCRIIPLCIYQSAFEHGQTEIVTYIQQESPSYLPVEKNIIIACENGFLSVLKLLPLYVKIPHECWSKAAKAKNHDLIYYLHERHPDVPFTKRMLFDAIKSCSNTATLAIYDCGKFKELPKDIVIALINKKMYPALKAFQSFGVDIYNEQMFTEAARVCSLQILQHMSDTHDMNFSDKIYEDALRKVYVSSENTGTRTVVMDFISQVRKKRKVSHHKTSSSNQIIGNKRSKNINDQSCK